MKKIVFLLAIAMLISAHNVMAETYVISVNQFVEHPALDAVLKGLQDYLKDNGIETEFKVHNAQATWELPPRSGSR